MPNDTLFTAIQDYIDFFLLLAVLSVVPLGFWKLCELIASVLL